MAELPTGTVTFLFTDIEGSTRLWEQHPEAMRRALVRHDALLRAALKTNSGSVFKTMGDQFCVVFPTAPAASAAALTAQHALQHEQWEAIGPLRVRMALHTGAAEERGGDYFGPPLNRVARLLAAAHGGQVLLSQAACDEFQGACPPESSLRDLGLHRLRDLQQPERIFQLLHPDLPADFPPLRSLEAFGHNLPVQLTSFVGREQQMADVRRLLRSTHLLTLTGAGGCGKTRLALQVAADLLEEYSDGVWLVELAALSDPALVPQTVASALGIREEPSRPVLQTLQDSLRPKSLLLLLDNCEHLVGACAQMSEALLRACPNLRVLATSREALGVAGEAPWRVPSLSMPDPKAWSRVEGQATSDEWKVMSDEKRPVPTHHSSLITHHSSTDTLLQYEAARLFIERAQTLQPTFAVTHQNARALAQVCCRLDGIPLAIELAAARVKVLSIEQIADRLDDRFRLLTGGSRTALPRQQTLRALIDWSYDLLSTAEQTLLRRLSVFAGGWTLEAADAVCGDDDRPSTTDHRQRNDDEPSVVGGRWSVVERLEVLDLLTSLVDKSLVIYEDQGDETRFRLLETVRQYARDRLLEAGEAAQMRGYHLDHLLRWAEDVAPKLTGAEQTAWLAHLETEHDNLRAALDWSVEQGETEAGLRLAGALWRFWWVRGYLGEGRERLAVVLAQEGACRPMEGRAKALIGAGTLAWTQGEYPAAQALFEESLAICRERGDPRGISAALGNLGMVAEKQGDYASARSLYEESLAIRRELGDKQGMAAGLNNLGLVAWNHGEYAEAQALFEESLAIKRELGDRRGIATSLNNLGLVAADQGDYSTAWAHYQESLAIDRELGDRRGISILLGNLGMVAEKQGDYEAARSLYDESLAIDRELGDRLGIAGSIYNLGSVASNQREDAAGRALFAESLAIRRELGDKQGIAECLEGLAGVAGAQGQPQRAARLFGAAEALREAIGAPLAPSERAGHDLRVAAARGALSDEAFSTAWSEGRTLSLDAALAVALQV